ncbi:MAG: efflux RND transporter permease subunit [Phycisphaerae bacterium]|nr:efflux RND transporter permease subunit [Phycisphaerae bacterium]
MRGLVEFGVKRTVVINLLTIAIIAAGISCLFSLRREFFPEANPDQALIAIAYPGASPQEVEEGMARKIEDAVADLDGIKRIRSNLAEGGGTVLVELRQGTSARKAVDDIRVAIDGLQDLPEDAERIRVTELEPNLPAIFVSVFTDEGEGQASEGALKRAIRDVADDLRALPGMGNIVTVGTRKYELGIEVNPFELKRAGISLAQVSDIVRAWMAEVPAGTLRTPEASLGVRTLGVSETAEAVRRIPLKATTGGQLLTIDEIGTVREGFADDQLVRRFNGKPCASLIVFKKGEEDAVKMAELVRGYVTAKRGEPFVDSWQNRLFGSDRKTGYEAGLASTVVIPGEIRFHNDLARIIEGRLDLLTRNAIQGALLVLLVMVLVMNVRAAVRVMSGIVVAVAATLVLMKFTGTTLNLITMFGLLIVIGMLADDAIVVSDNILAHFGRGKSPDQAAIDGTTEIFWPVVGTVLTTIVAFVPLAYLGGRFGELLSALPIVASVALGSSLLETLVILPNHMAGVLRKMQRPSRGRFITQRWRRFEEWRERRVMPSVEARYAAVAHWCLDRRYLTSAVTLAVLVVSIGMVAGGRVPFTFLAADDTETLIIDLRLPIGSPLDSTSAVVRRFEEAARAQPEVSAVNTTLGQSANFETGVPDASATHVAQLFLELVPVENRDRRSGEVVTAIRAAAGSTNDVEEMRISEITGGPAGADLTFEVRGDDPELIRAAAVELKSAMSEFEGVFDVTDDDYSSQRELRISLRPAAAALGFSVADVARQVRGMLFGLEAHVYSENREDIKVRVRLDEAARSRVDSIEGLWITTQRGQLVPLNEVATVSEGTAYSVVRRIDRQRTVTVTGDCGPGTNPEEITRALQPTIDRLSAQFPTLSLREGGRQKDLNEALATLPLASSAALLLVYVILAWLFSSYLQPLAVMLAIPFSVIGVIWGHWLLGYDLTFLSVIGFVALAGVVVNNSLIFVEFSNAATRQGMRLDDSLVAAGRQRLRPIFLTTVTTVFGLLPLLLEQSFQARFLIPMAIAITAGLASATVLTLFLLPALIVVIDDCKEVLHRLWFGTSRAARSKVLEGTIAVK